MEFQRLRYFIAVAEEENVTRAAGRLHIAQSALSRQIRALEESLGVPLFEHGARSIKLSRTGQAFLPKARELIQRLQESTDFIRDYYHGKSQKLEIGYVPSLTKEFLPGILEKLRQFSPGIHISLHDLSTQEMEQGLLDGSLQVALMVNPPGDPIKGLQYTEIKRHRPSVVMALAHPLAGFDELDAARLFNHAFIMLNREGYPEHYDWLAGILGNEAPFTVAAECDTVGSMLVLLECGVGVAVLQEGFCELAPGRLVERPVKNAEQFAFSFGVARKAGNRNPVVERFYHLVSSCIQARN